MFRYSREIGELRDEIESLQCTLARVRRDQASRREEMAEDTARFVSEAELGRQRESRKEERRGRLSALRQEIAAIDEELGHIRSEASQQQQQQQQQSPVQTTPPEACTDISALADQLCVFARAFASSSTIAMHCVTVLQHLLDGRDGLRRPVDAIRQAFPDEASAACFPRALDELVSLGLIDVTDGVVSVGAGSSSADA